MSDGGRRAPRTDGRRVAVLEAALLTFARQGYRRTSMDDVARAARISRPGLYLHAASKHALLVDAVEHALTRDVRAAEAVLGARDRALRDRLLDAFDLWAGQYVGPLTADLDGLLEQDAALLGDLPAAHAARFGAAVARALREADEPAVRLLVPTPEDAEAARDVLLALVSGTKHQAVDRDDFRIRLARGLALLLR